VNNELFGKVKRPTEAVIDGRTMNLLGNTLNDVTRSANRGVSAFDTMGFLARVAAKLAPNAVGGGDDEDGATADGRRQRRRLADDDAHAAGWTVVGRMAAKHTCRIPVADFMLGPLNLPPKAKKTRKPIDAEASQKRKEKRKEAPQTQPQHFDAAAQEAEPETSREVQRIHRLLGTQGGEQGVPFFKFICHPDSFARSVENLFHLSFLRACCRIWRSADCGSQGGQGDAGQGRRVGCSDRQYVSETGQGRQVDPASGLPAAGRRAEDAGRGSRRGDRAHLGHVRIHAGHLEGGDRPLRDHRGHDPSPEVALHRAL